MIETSRFSLLQESKTLALNTLFQRDLKLTPPAELLASYEAHRPLVEQLYAQARFWHGTGRYLHHRIEGITDVLVGVINEGGLVTHKDIADFTQGQVNTISLAKNRMYARFYANTKQQRGHEFQFSFGSSRRWARHFLLPTFAQWFKDFYKHDQALTDKRAYFAEMVQASKRWVAKHDGGFNQPTSFRKFVQVRSDIEGNHAMLFGIRGRSVVPAPAGPSINIFEVRSLSGIPWDDLTHIEVPAENLQADAEILLRYGISVPLIPIEFGELFCREFSMAHIVSGQPLVKTPTMV